jgi:hypothetical protein
MRVRDQDSPSLQHTYTARSLQPRSTISGMTDEMQRRVWQLRAGFGTGRLGASSASPLRLDAIIFGRSLPLPYWDQERKPMATPEVFDPEITVS